MPNEFTGTMSSMPKGMSFREKCIEILRTELQVLYHSQLQGMTDYYTVKIIESRDESDTMRMLQDETLPMPVNQRHPPVEVRYFRACFQEDPGKEVELLIGRFDGFTWACALGIHDGQKWVYTPLSLPQGMKREI